MTAVDDLPSKIIEREYDKGRTLYILEPMQYTLFSHRRFLLSLFIGLIGIGVFGVYFVKQVPTTSSEETLWVVDNSLSMAVEDIHDRGNTSSRSRLDLARSIVMSGVTLIPGKHAIITYARNAWILAPFTSDIPTLGSTLSHIEPILENGGSDINAAFALINTLYTTNNHQINIILLTDGGDTGSGALPSLPPGATLRIIGIGTNAWWPIPLGYDAAGQRRYKIYENKEITVPYDPVHIDRIVQGYHAAIERIQSLETVDSVMASLKSQFTNSLPLSNSSEWILLITGSILLLLALFLHPYAHTSQE